MMARHWPEAAAHIDVYEQRSWITLMKTFPGPDAIAEDPNGAKDLLRKASRGQFDKEQLEGLIALAQKTTGVPMTAGEQEKLRAIVEQLEAQLKRLRAVDSKLGELIVIVASARSRFGDGNRNTGRPESRDSAARPQGGEPNEIETASTIVSPPPDGKRQRASRRSRQPSTSVLPSVLAVTLAEAVAPCGSTRKETVTMPRFSGVRMASWS